MNRFDVLAIRRLLGLSARELADALGLHLRSVQDWERGTSGISTANQQRLLELLDAHTTLITTAAAALRNGEHVEVPASWTRSQLSAFAARIRDHDPSLPLNLRTTP